MCWTSVTRSDTEEDHGADEDFTLHQCFKSLHCSFYFIIYLYFSVTFFALLRVHFSSISLKGGFNLLSLHKLKNE